MKFMNQSRFYGQQYREEAGDDGDKGGGVDAAAFAKMQADLAASLESIGKLEENNKALLKEKADAKSAAQAAADEAAKKSGDVEALEKSWADKLQAETSARDEKLKSLQARISDMTSGASARAIAAELAIPGSAEALIPHIASRLKTEFGDGDPIVRVLDVNGKPSAMSVEDLKKEISNNKAFAPLIVGSQANGDGKPGSKGDTRGKTCTREQWDKMAPIDRSKFVADGGSVTD